MSFKFRVLSFELNGFVGNGLDRSGISVFTAMLYKIRTEYNIMRLEPEQASKFPTTSFRVFFNSAFRIPNSKLYYKHLMIKLSYDAIFPWKNIESNAN